MDLLFSSTFLNEDGVQNLAYLLSSFKNKLENKRNDKSQRNL